MFGSIPEKPIFKSYVAKNLHAAFTLVNTEYTRALINFLKGS